MNNTFAIGTPDKVSRAERDNQEVNRIFAELKFGKEKVIEFDLPKGYSAEDAFYTALCYVWYVDAMQNIELSKHLNFLEKKNQLYIGLDDIKNHFGWNSDLFTLYDAANFYLLLAVANGHNLEV